MCSQLTEACSQMTEECKQDGCMTPEFLVRVNNPKNAVFFVCEFTGMEVLLEDPEYRNGVIYRVKEIQNEQISMCKMWV